MSRSDVPILVRPKPNAIDIKATHRQHSVFHAFFHIIDSSKSRAHAHPGHGFAGPGADLFARGFGPGADCSNPNCKHCRKADEHRARVDAVRDRIRAELDAVRVKMRDKAEHVRIRARQEAERIRESFLRHARQARGQAHVHEELVRQLERQAEELHEQGERFREHGHSMREQAQQLRERVREIFERAKEMSEDDDARERVRRRADELHEEARALEDKAGAMDGHAGTFDEKAQMLMNHIRGVQEQVEGLEVHAEHLRDRVEAVDDAVRSLREMIDVSPELALSLLARADGTDAQELLPVARLSAIEPLIQAALADVKDQDIAAALGVQVRTAHPTSYQAAQNQAANVNQKENPTKADQEKSEGDSQPEM